MDTPREDWKDEDVGVDATAEKTGEERDEAAGYEFYQKDTPTSAEDTMNDASLIEESEKMTPEEPDKRQDETIV